MPYCVSLGCACDLCYNRRVSAVWAVAGYGGHTPPPFGYEESGLHFVSIGHLTRDVVADGYTLGGTAAYAAITARRLGATVTVVTRAHPADTRHPSLDGIAVVNLPGELTTTFHNIYENGRRRQLVRAVAAPIFAHEVPAALWEADVVLLGPVAQEVDPAIAPRPRGLVGVVPQGWLREWDEYGRVYGIPWYCAGRVLPHTDVLVVSTQDLTADPDFARRARTAAPIVVITLAAQGCALYVEGAERLVPPRPAQEVDPTGAGDVFAAAFLIRLHETRDPVQAAYFANITASFSVEGQGVSGIPTRAQVEAYLRSHPWSPAL